MCSPRIPSSDWPTSRRTKKVTTLSTGKDVEQLKVLEVAVQIGTAISEKFGSFL